MPLLAVCSWPVRGVAGSKLQFVGAADDPRCRLRSSSPGSTLHAMSLTATQYAQARQAPGVHLGGAPPATGPMSPPARGVVATPPIQAHGPGAAPGGGVTATPPHIGVQSGPPVFRVSGTTVPIAQPFPNVQAALAFVAAHFPHAGSVTISST